MKNLILLFSILYVYLCLIKFSHGEFVLTVALLKFDSAGYRANDGSGEDNQHCSPFWYAQMNCNIQLSICIDWNLDGEACQAYEGTDTPTWIDLGSVTENTNAVTFEQRKYKAWNNPMQYVGSGNYTGFRLSLNATDYRQHKLIDAFNHTFATMEEQYNDFAYYSHFREGVDEPTLIAIAWKVEGTDIKPLPTDTPTTTTTTTLPPSIFSYDCSDRTKVNKSGVYQIQPNPLDPTNIVSVYCDVGDNNAYTVVQSRGGSGADEFPTKTTLADYTTPFGKPGVDTNFWFGLDNFNYLTSNTGYNYSLQIDLCCGANLTTSLHYDNFKVSGSSDGYILKATAEVSQLGIDSPGPAGAMPDIGSKFSTYDDYQGLYSKKICSVYKYTRGDGDANAIGGWWVGSCTNNLNGHFYGVGDPIFYSNNTCQINTDLISNTSVWHGTGIEMRTLGLPQSLDAHSYTRVRMALYRVDSGYGIPTNTTNFCTATPTTSSTTSGTETASTVPSESINSET